MKPGTTRYTIVWNQAGQPRPYADHTYDFELIVEWNTYSLKPPEQWVPRDLNDQLMETAAKILGHSWIVNGDWAAPRLESKMRLGPGHWRFVVKQSYTD